MALEVVMTGTGSIGDIAPGWSANESTNSNVIGESNASTGTVSFTARSTDESLLVINNDTVSYVHDLGTVHGVVQSVSETGINVSVTHGSVADRLNLDVQVQPVAEGGPKAWCSALEYAIGVGANPYNAPINYVPDYALNAASFSFINSPLSANFVNTINDFWNANNIYVGTPTRVFGNGTLSSTQNNGVGPTGLWNGLDASELAEINTMPDWFLTENPPVKQVGVYGNPVVYQLSIQHDSGVELAFGFSNGTNSTYALVSGSAKTFSLFSYATLDYSTLDDSEPLLFTIQIYPYYDSFAGTPVRTNVIQYSVTDHNNDVVYDVAGGAIDGDGKVYMPWYQINADEVRFANFFVAPEAISGDTIMEYIEPITIPEATALSLFDFTGYTGTSNAAYPSTTGIGWELLQQLASAENFEIAISGDKIYVRDIGTTGFDITNIVASPTITPTSTLSGRQINIPYTDASYVTGTIYDAQADANNIISVNAGETIITSVKHTVHPLAVTQPRLVDGTTWPLEPGQYAIADSSGYYLNAEEWSAYGGSVTVSIDSEDPAAIQIIVVGPYTDVTLAGGPYELAVSDGSNKYAALTIAGAGVYSGNKVLELITGIDEEKYTRGIVNTINNPFIRTEEQAYNRGVWASWKASGPTISLNLTVPVSSLSGIGLTCGSLINYRDSTYRITSCVIGGISASLTADFFAEVGRFDESWDGSTVFDYNLAWSGYECQDQVIFPYLKSEAPPI